MAKLNKKGDVWISVVLYTAIGVIALTIILSAGLPLIQKMRDKNTVAQTKQLMAVVDENIRAVISEGPGSRRFLSPLEIKAGDLYIETGNIEPDGDRIYWTFKTTAKMVEPRWDSNGNPIIDANTDGVPDLPEFREGALRISSNESIIVDEYIFVMGLDYSNFADIELNSPFTNPFKGLYSMTIENTGTFVDNRPVIAISMTA